MTKKEQILSQIEKLNQEKEYLLRQVSQKEQLIAEQKELFQNLYEEFFYEKTSKKFIYYQDFPTQEELENYYIYGSKLRKKHPIQEYGNFNIKELVEIIKLAFSFQYGEEYQIQTFGTIDQSWNESKARLFFLIGNSYTLLDYQQYNSIFLNESCTLPIQFTDGIKDLIIMEIPQQNIKSSASSIDIICNIPNHQNKSGINYFDYQKEEYHNQEFLNIKNIFRNRMEYKQQNYRGIQDTLSIPIHPSNNFIAKILISIAIFKKNNQKKELTNEDYQYIFYELFHDNTINMQKEIEKDIPKILKYQK